MFETPVKVSTAYVRGMGTLLMNAVGENKLDLVRLLLEYGFVSFPLKIAQKILRNVCFLSCFRVDPTAKADGHDNSSSPVEFALVNQCDQVLVILQEFTEIPDDEKFDPVKEWYQKNRTSCNFTYEGV